VLIDPRYYVIGDHVSGLLISASTEGSQTLFVRNQSAVQIMKRVDGQPRLAGPITLADGGTQVSAFVVWN
jgi:hypothetical protein